VAGSIAIIGFGEAGAIFGNALACRTTVEVFDTAFSEDHLANQFKARSGGPITWASSQADATKGAAVVFSLVTASSALDVALEAATHLKPGQIFLDLNSVSPGTKRRAAAAMAISGASYVDGAIMAPVAPYGLAVPILVAGLESRTAQKLLGPFGMNIKTVDGDIGTASATKMCRSVIIKGIEALCSEAFLAARKHGVEEQVLDSLNDTFPGTDWRRFAGYQIGRSLLHGRRRAAEMREASLTVSEAGILPTMSDAIALRQDRSADLADRVPALKHSSEDDWITTLDVMLTRLHEVEAF
jgi:3-hydroxyisobutyrate dehydrogenase-like beta-hydroxyacid dehydrogenase